MPIDLDRPPALADLIRRHRQEARIRQQDVADALGVWQVTVSTWETGQHIPSYENLLRLVVLLNIDPVLVGQAYGLMLSLDAEEARNGSSAGLGEPGPALTAAAGTGGSKR